MPNMRWPMPARSCRCRPAYRSGRSGGPAGSRLHRLDQCDGHGRLQPGETPAGPWRHQRHRQPGHPDFRGAGTAFSPPRAATKNARRRASCGAARAINYREEDFVAVVKAETGGKGVDVILDMVGGDYIQRNIEAAAPVGPHRQHRLSERLQGRGGFRPRADQATDPGGDHPAGPHGGRKARHPRRPAGARSGPWLGTRIQPVIDRVFPLDQAQEAHEFMAKTGHIGKILLQARLESLCARAGGARLKDRIPRKD